LVSGSGLYVRRELNGSKKRPRGSSAPIGAGAGAGASERHRPQREELEVPSPQSSLSGWLDALRMNRRNSRPAAPVVVVSATSARDHVLGRQHMDRIQEE
jgi:hypothetical protein